MSLRHCAPDKNIFQVATVGFLSFKMAVMEKKETLEFFLVNKAFSKERNSLSTI